MYGGASRNGAKHHAITVDCVPIMDIVGEFGVADYMKIDIEGNKLELTLMFSHAAVDDR